MATREPLYVMRAAPAIRLIYRKTADGVEVLDVVEKATLQAFLNKATKPTPAGGPALAVKSSPAKSAASVKRSGADKAGYSGGAKAAESHAKKPVGSA